jgi:hypothetical protein
MTRLYRLNPIAAGSRGLNIGITLPPAVPVVEETVCPPSTGGLEWGYLDAEVTSVTATAEYSDNTFSAEPTASTVVWEWTAGDSGLLCQIVNTSGFPINHSVLDFTITVSGTGSTMAQTATSNSGTDTLFNFFVPPGRAVAMALDQVQVTPVSFQVLVAIVDGLAIDIPAG